MNERRKLPAGCITAIVTFTVIGGMVLYVFITLVMTGFGGEGSGWDRR